MPRNLKNQMKVIMFPDALAQPVCMGIKHIMHTHYYPESSVSSTWSHADSQQMRRREGKDAKKRRRRRKMIRIILLQRQLCKHCCCVSSYRQLDNNRGTRHLDCCRYFSGLLPRPHPHCARTPGIIADTH